MEIKKIFNENSAPFSFIDSSSQLKNREGELIFKNINIRVPKDWAQISVDIIVQKYFRKQGIPKVLKKVHEEGIPEWLQKSEADIDALNKLPENERYIGEVSAEQIFRRLAGAWTYWGYKLGYFDSEISAKNYFEEIQYILYHQIAAPNSPQWFNTGLNWAYGITGTAQGHYYFDEELNKVIESQNAYERPQPHACFIQSIDDSLLSEGGIMDLFVKEARLFKYGSGTGTNFSKIRARGEKLSGGGLSSGLMSFLKIGDTAAGAIKSGGTTRRAAKMVILDIDHPDVEEFINWKVKEEQKVVALVTGSHITYKIIKVILETCKNFEGTIEEKIDPNKNNALKKILFVAKNLMVPEKYIHRTLLLVKQNNYTLDFPTFVTGWDTESYHTVAGQNSNNSLSLSNKFLQQVKAQGTWDLLNRVDNTIAKTVEAKDLWEKINYATWSCADPGLQFTDTINEWNTCATSGKINASNPCSEYLFLDDTACNLASINLLKFRKDNGTFDVTKFKHITNILTITLEISVAMAQFPSKKIAELSYKFRTLGLGYANLGAYLMSIGVAYDSEEGRAITAAITALLTGQAYVTSALLAKEKGAFSEYKKNAQDMLRVINNHKKAVYGFEDHYEGLSILPQPLKKQFCEDIQLIIEARQSWDQALSLGEKYGFRNAQVSCIAPTGTIGLLMDCSTTGIEPDFSLVKYKSLAGGGYFKIINNTVSMALKHLGYSESEIVDIINYTLGFKTLKNAPYINYETLKEKGFTDVELEKIEKSLEEIFNIEFAFNQYILGEDFCKNILHLDLEALKNPNVSLLKSIGFTQEEIIQANIYVTGALTVEGAPHLKEEHLKVFDCANLCGPKGTRYLSYQSHIKMLAVAQSFISGGISKTINMHSKSTIEDCKNAYMLSWELGVKANSLYRDGSKLSQPLQSSLLNDDTIENYDILNDLLQSYDNKQSVSNNDNINHQDNIRKVATYGVTQMLRKRPANNRKGYTQKVYLSGHKIYLHTGEYNDGSLAEIFLDTYKEGATFKSLMNSFAIAISIGLQYGVPLEEYVDAFTFTKFEPSGIVIGHDKIKFSTSMLDYIFRDLAINYLGMNEFSHVNTKEDTKDKEISQNKIESKNIQMRETTTNNNGYEGEPCLECNNMTMKRSGTCLVCTTCGSTTGCS